MAHRDLIVVGASAGGVEALQELCAGLPPEFPAAVLAVIHTSNHAESLLPNVLGRRAKLPVKHPTDGETIKKGWIYIAPPDCHMMVDDGHVRLVKGPRENLHRPAIDPTFRSAALAYGPRVIGVILSGMLNDGTSGLMLIRAAGGTAIVQDPQTALFPSMPSNALKWIPDACVRPVSEIPELLQKLVTEEVKVPLRPALRDEAPAREVRIAEFDMSEIENEMRNGKPSAFGCPECGGVLWEIDQNGLLRFRCRVGHAYTSLYLQSEQRHTLETALWSGLRALEENASLNRKLAERARDANEKKMTGTFEERAKTAERNSDTLRKFLIDLNSPESDLGSGSEAAD